MKYKVIECELTQATLRKDKGRELRFTDIQADSLDVLLIGLEERAVMYGPRVVFCSPELADTLQNSNRVVKVGRKYSSHALQYEFVDKEASLGEGNTGVAFLQDSRFEMILEKKRTTSRGIEGKPNTENDSYWGIKTSAGVTKGIDSMLEATGKLAKRAYLVLLDQEQFDELVTKAKGGLVFDSQMPALKEQYIGNSPLISKIREQILAASRDPRCSVLILGESGTGKSEIAKLIHEYTTYEVRKDSEEETSTFKEREGCFDLGVKLVPMRTDRASRIKKTKPRFTKVNCAAIPPQMFEATMFGTRKGVATDVGETMGKFEQANGGTLFLDEVANIDPLHQPKFLTVLRAKEVERVGQEEDPIKLSQRIIFATNADLLKQCREDKLREDLYWRLGECDIAIHTVPLRHHPEDIPLHANQIWGACIKKCSQSQSAHKSQVMPNLPGDLLEEFTKFSWPGNVSQLQGVVKKMHKNAVNGSKAPSVEQFLEIVSKEHNPLAERVILAHTTNIVDRMCDEVQSLMEAIPSCPEVPSDLGETIQSAIRHTYESVKEYRSDPKVRARDGVFRKLRAVENDLEDAIRFLESQKDGEDSEWPDTLKQNLGQVLPQLLDDRGVLIRMQGARDLRNEVAIDTDLLALREVLGKTNHDIWMEMRLAEGWRYGKERNDLKKTHPDLVHYDALSEGEKQYDRNMAIGAIRALHHLGYRLVKDQSSPSGKDKAPVQE